MKKRVGTTEGTKGFTLIELLLVVALVGLLTAIAIPNLLNAIDRGRQSRTMADLRYLATAIEEYAIDNTSYPNLPTETDIQGSSLEAILKAVYLRSVPTRDAWGGGLRYAGSLADYTVGSPGKDGSSPLSISGTGGPTTSFDCDIVYSHGAFIQWPQGTQEN
ncbi:MAG: type II secretion system protein GspG [Acidobacteriota bacterium]